MSKPLSEMSLKELWELFPIFLEKHNVKWSEQYAAEAAVLERLVGHENIVRLSHIGSTAVSTIWAKPIVDILLEIRNDKPMEEVRMLLTDGGYICMSSEKDRLSFNKGYTEKGFADKVFHLHLRYDGDNDELYFRDYINADIAAAREYEALKLSLWKRFEHDRDGYTSGKTDFIKGCTKKAKILFGARYERGRREKNGLH